MVLAATEDVLAALVGATVVAYGVWRLVRRRRENASAGRELTRDTPEAVAAAREASAALLAEYGGWMYLDPSVLAVNETFEHGVATLADADVSPEALLELAEEGDWMLTAIAFAAIGRRDDVADRWADVAVRRLRAFGSTTQYFILRALARRAPRPVIASVLSQLDRLDRTWLAPFLTDRLAADEPLDAELLAKEVPIRLVPLVAEFLEDEGSDLPPAFRDAFEAWRRSVVDVDLLREFADVWERPFEIAPASLSGARAHLADLVLDALSGSPAQSVLLVGENGVGKTTLVRSTLERLPPGWIVFEASAAAVSAGAMYIGELEGRVQQLVGRLRGHEAVWVFPAFEEALYAGQHTRSPVGLLDLLLPHVESAALTIVAEITPAAYARLVKARPRVAAAFRALRVRPLPARESVAVAADALAASGARASEQVLREAFELAHQFLPGSAAPGNLVRLVEAAAEAVAERGEDELEVRDVLATLAGATGLPLALLDPTAPLDVGSVRAFLEERVLGQPEAVEALVERITLIKAGLTDPTRPLGVFLFVGPTGTGKTEIAKALAEFLFGSPERMVRLDLTEFQTPESLERLLSDTQEGPSAGLIASVRRDPFSVVLLDEFEKAAPPIWDVFLPVFDDGRLTDTEGQTTDFTRCVIVLTSNVGSAIATQGGLGFAPDAEPFRRESVERAVARSFRPEFLNRIDRLVVFRPFERSQMRALLDKELAQALRRKGLRTRPWAVELDASAVAFLIEQGFSPELGARPLKRALERHLLAPLARVIVEKTAPEGDQFLFVGAPPGRGIEVAFVDPNAEPAVEEREGPADADAAAEQLDVRAVALSRRADARAARFLLRELERIATAAGGEAVDARKQEALASVAQPGFWDDPDRFSVLAEIEYLDRFEAALATAEKLGRRLDRQLARNGGGDRGELAALLANRLHVLDSALTGLAEGAPFDLFLRIRPAAAAASDETARLVDDLAAMYLEWAVNRGMRLEELAGGGAGAARTFAVSGLGAGAILEPEAGLHVRELPRAAEGGAARVERASALVELAPMAPGTGEPLLPAAEGALAHAQPRTRVVRRYRDEPNPLVRDAARGYRTGRLARVLAGDFDLF